MHVTRGLSRSKIQAARARTRLSSDAGELGCQNVHDGVAVSLTADLATSSVRIMILVEPANQPGKVAQAEAF